MANLRIFLALLFLVLPFVMGAPVYVTTEDVDRMRAEGLSEATILARISTSLTAPTLLDAIFIPARDDSGDISPGSLPAPQMFPLASRPIHSASEKLRHCLIALLGLEVREPPVPGTAYEGHEGELRRPTGSRFWGKMY